MGGRLGRHELGRDDGAADGAGGGGEEPREEGARGGAEGGEPRRCSGDATEPEAPREFLPPSFPFPPADGACFLLELPGSLQISVLSYVSYQWRNLQRYGALCSSFRSHLDEDVVWQHLCHDYWFVEEEHFARWPQFRSWRALYRTLERWAVLEGFYRLPSAFPWCLLVAVRFENGSLVAEAIRFCSEGQEGRRNEEGAEEEARPGGSQELNVRLFEVSFSEEPGGVRASIVFPSDTKGLLANRSATVGALPATVPGRLPIASQARFHRAAEVVPRWIPHGRGFSVELEETQEDAEAGFASGAKRRRGAEEVPDSISEGGGSDSDDSAASEPEDQGRSGLGAWDPNAWLQAHGARRLGEVTARMACELLSATGSLPLSLVRSPLEYRLDDPLAELLRPGLYVGNYGHSFYGQFKHEVLIVEFHECAPDDIDGLFQRPGDRELNVAGQMVLPQDAGSGVPDDLRRMLREHVATGESVGFLVGTKVTGDFHVPAGQATFVALVTPHAAKDRLNSSRGEEVREVRNRNTGTTERIRCAWPGFGTLAMPGFAAPSWADGWLVRLEPSHRVGRSDDDLHRFGFMWERNQDVVVLEYVRMQTTAPFLSRKWLPEDLR